MRTWLRRPHHLVWAGMAFPSIPGFSGSEDCAAVEQLLRGYDEQDEEQVSRVCHSPLLKYMDNDVSCNAPYKSALTPYIAASTLAALWRSRRSSSSLCLSALAVCQAGNQPEGARGWEEKEISLRSWRTGWWSSGSWGGGWVRRGPVLTSRWRRPASWRPAPRHIYPGSVVHLHHYDRSMAVRYNICKCYTS